MTSPSSVIDPYFFDGSATATFYTLSLHDALPISARRRCGGSTGGLATGCGVDDAQPRASAKAGSAARHRRSVGLRSEEHTSELQSRLHLVCRLPLEKTKITATTCASIPAEICQGH